MDKSETYVKQCEKADEIQLLAPKPAVRDYNDRNYTSFFYLPQTGTVEVLKWDNDTIEPIIGDYNDDATGAVWLPRQDQLQEVLSLPIDELWTEFSIWVEEFAIKGMGDWRLREYKSFEQLWLAFVMHEKYQKRWNGTGWVLEVAR